MLQLCKWQVKSVSSARNVCERHASCLYEALLQSTCSLMLVITQCTAAPERDIVVAGCKLHMFRCNKVIREEAAPVAAMFNSRDCAFTCSSHVD